MSPEASSVTGDWLTSNVEIARGPMLAWTDPIVHTLTVMACTQLLKTELLNNIAAYHIHQDPAPIILIQPTTKLGESWSKDRFDKMRRDMPELRERVKDPRSRDSGTTISHKEFPGGHLTIVGANSPVDLASRPIRIVLADEVDKYPASAGKEGDPLSLVEERSATFWNRKSARVCSPTIEGSSRIDQEYEASDKRKPFVACPACGHLQVMTWERVRWDKDAAGQHLPETAKYHCEACPEPFSEKDRQRLCKTEGAIVWRQTARFTCCGIEQEPEAWDAEGRSLCRECGERSPFDGHAGFWGSKLYSPWEGLAVMARKWLKAVGKPNLLKTFYNTQLGLPFQDGEDAPEWQRLYDRRESWAPGTVPDGVVMMLGAIDVQGDRVELHVWGFGDNAESWAIQREISYGRADEPRTWAPIEAAMRQKWRHPSGTEIGLDRVAVDTGDQTLAVYTWVATQDQAFVYAVKGRPGYEPNSPVATPTYQPLGQRKRAIRLHGVFGEVFKGELYRFLGLNRPTDEEIAASGYPYGYVHVPDYLDSGWCQQLVAEQRVRSRTGKFEWKKLHERNEALDCRVYARAMLWTYGVAAWSPERWQAEREARRLNVRPGQMPEPKPQHDLAARLAKLNRR